MKHDLQTYVKAIVIGTVPLIGGVVNAADPKTPATQPATQPVPASLANANAPLIIPDGTTGPVPALGGARIGGGGWQGDSIIITGVRV